MSTETIIQLIIAYALNSGIDPQLALAVAKVESNFRPNVVGSIGEIGIFQVRPEFSQYSVEQLKNPHVNIKEGMRILKHAKRNCIHKESKTWVVCYNTGVTAGKKIKYPKQFPYYKKVILAKNYVKKYIAFSDMVNFNTTIKYMVSYNE